jgi:hypothetical protein
VLYGFPEQRFVDLVRGKDLIRQLERANRLSTEIHYINLCHIASLREAAVAALAPGAKAPLISFAFGTTKVVP